MFRYTTILVLPTVKFNAQETIRKNNLAELLALKPNDESKKTGFEYTCKIN